MAEKKIYYIEDDVNEARRESKIIRYTVGKTIDRYDFEKKAFVLDDEMLKIYFGAIEASIVSKDEAYAAIEKFTKRFYS